MTLSQKAWLIHIVHSRLICRLHTSMELALCSLMHWSLQVIHLNVVILLLSFITNVIVKAICSAPISYYYY